MKKIISLMLVLMLAFCLVACGNNEEEQQEEQDEIIIGFNTNGLTNETMTFMVDVFQNYCDENGIKLLVSEDTGDPAILLSNLENFVAAGCDGIIFMNYDTEAVEPMLLELKEKGIATVSYDEYSELCDYSFLCSNYDLGYAIGKMAADWANENINSTEPVEVGLIAVDRNSFLKIRGDGIEEGLSENLKAGVTVYRESLGSGASAVDIYSNLCSAHPGIKMFVSIADTCVTGVAEAWYGDLVGQGADISQYGVFATDATDIALNLINKSKTNEAIFRATIDLGLKDRVPLGMIKCCHAAILGQEAEGYETTNYYEVKIVDESNVDEYSEYLD